MLFLMLLYVLNRNKKLLLYVKYSNEKTSLFIIIIIYNNTFVIHDFFSLNYLISSQSKKR